MLGASLVQLSQLRLKDIVKVVNDDGSFEGSIETVSEEGITFKSVRTGEEYIIAIQDIPGYDFYPRGKTIQELQVREALLSSKYESKALSQEINETKFFELFQQYQTLGTDIIDIQDAAIMLDKLHKFASEHPNNELDDALDFAIAERNKTLESTPSHLSSQ